MVWGEQDLAVDLRESLRSAPPGCSSISALRTLHNRYIDALEDLQRSCAVPGTPGFLAGLSTTRGSGTRALSAAWAAVGD